jgi:hypothetical protein
MNNPYPKVFDTTQPPPRRVQGHAQWAVPLADEGRIICEEKYRLARLIAEKIVNEDTFFKFSRDGFFGSVRIDAIVLTESELHDLMRKQFEAGMKHAMGWRIEPGGL